MAVVVKHESRVGLVGDPEPRRLQIGKGHLDAGMHLVEVREELRQRVADGIQQLPVPLDRGVFHPVTAERLEDGGCIEAELFGRGGDEVVGDRVVVALHRNEVLFLDPRTHADAVPCLGTELLGDQPLDRSVDESVHSVSVSFR